MKVEARNSPSESFQRSQDDGKKRHSPVAAGGLSRYEVQLQEKELKQQLKDQMEVLKKLQDAQKDESGVRLDERQNLSIQRKR